MLSDASAVPTFWKMKTALIPVIGDARHDRVGAIDLFQCNDEGHLVLESEGTERPKKVSGLTHAFGKPIRPANEERALFARVGFDSLHLFRESATGQFLPALIEHETKATFASTEQLTAFTNRIRRSDVRGINSGKTTETSEVFGHACPGVGESRFANCNDTPAQGGSYSRGRTGWKSAAWYELRTSGPLATNSNPFRRAISP
jgi:hypothetical protein